MMEKIHRFFCTAKLRHNLSMCHSRRWKLSFWDMKLSEALRQTIKKKNSSIPRQLQLSVMPEHMFPSFFIAVSWLAWWTLPRVLCCNGFHYAAVCDWKRQILQWFNPGSKAGSVRGLQEVNCCWHCPLESNYLINAPKKPQNTVTDDVLQIGASGF